MKNSFLALAVVGVVAFSQGASADTTDLHANADFTSGVTLGNEQDFVFGTVDFSGSPGAGDTVSLGTDGSINYAGGNFGGLGTGTPGRVDVTAGTNGQIVEVFCDTSATLTNSTGASSIDAVNIKVAPENATGSYSGSGQPCNGTSGAAANSFTLNLGTLDTFVFGAQLDGGTATGLAGANYSTSNPGGDSVQVDVFYQ